MQLNKWDEKRIDAIRKVISIAHNSIHISRLLSKNYENHFWEIAKNAFLVVAHHLY
jgi:hypothetical protein